MRVSYEGIGHISVTFPHYRCEAGEVVKLDPDGWIVYCDDGDLFLGVAESVSKDTAGIQIHGFVKLKYTGTAPDYGYGKFCANGQGGIRTAADGREHLVVEVDEEESTVVIEL